jgi:hypothetical protein
VEPSATERAVGCHFCVPYERRLSLRPVWLTVGRT